MKKILFIINVLAFVITLTCYMFLGEMNGLYIQIFLGWIQVCIGLGFFIRWRKRGIAIKKNVLTYWSVVLLYGILFQFGINTIDKYKNGELFFLEVIPMSIAAYSVFITYINVRDKRVRNTKHTAQRVMQKEV